MDVLHSSEPESAEVEDGVYLTRLVAGENTSVVHFRIEPGARVPEHSHHHEQAGYVLQGELVFELEGEERSASAGDSYVLAGDEVHAAENRGDEPVEGIDIFSPPRTAAPFED